MRHEMSVERKAASEGAATLRAGEGPFTHVSLEVRHQRVLVREGNRTEGAAEGPGARVRVHVLLKHVLA